MIIDPKNALTFPAPLFGPKSQNNNTGGGGLDLSLLNFKGKLAVVVAIGTKTVGDNDATVSVRAVTSATNNISNATNYGTSTVSTTNNTSANGVISVDTRDANRFLFVVPTITGTNTPAYPVVAMVVGTEEVQPAQ